MPVSATMVNSMLSGRLENAEERSKLAQYAGDYIRDRLREESFARKILPPKNVTRADCQVSTKHDTLIKIEEIEPNSRAMAIDFRGSPDARLISAPRAEISFFTITSERFEKFEQELLAYTMPITKIIEDNSMKDIQEIEDREFLVHNEACIQALQLEANGSATAFNRTNVLAGNVKSVSVVKGSLALDVGGTDDFTVRPIQRRDIPELKKLHSGNRLVVAMGLMTERDFDDIGQWTAEDMGQTLQSETTVEGYKRNTLLGLKLIRTIKTDILRPGNIYTFTDPEFFGKFYILNNTKFYIDKEATLIWWQCWEDIGMGLINVAATRKLELYRGSVTTGATDTGYADRLPKEEEDLGAENNRVDAGTYFPHVNSF